jgi:autotransporter-associated beta strand protein
MRSYKTLKQSAVWVALLALAVSPARAADGKWNILIGGSWSTASFWLNGVIADGADSTATFSQNITANRTVTLDSDRTIGNLYFIDTGPDPDSRWTLQSNTLTLETTTGIPRINISSAVSAPVYISTVLAGTNGFEKVGNGTLMINGAATYTGDTVLSDGNIRLNGDNYLPATSVFKTLPGASTLQMMGYSQTLGGLDGTNGNVECHFNALATNLLTLAVAGAESYSFSGLLRDGQGTSELNIVKSGTGTQAFAGANDYSGTTIVSSGTLIGGADGAFGASSLTVDNGAALVLTNGVSNSYFSAEATLALGSSASLDLGFTGATEPIGGLSIDGGTTWLSDGIYSAAVLQSLGAGTYTGTGSLAVGDASTVVVGTVDIQLLTGADFSLIWSNTAGASYGVETNTDLVAGQWGTLQSNLTAIGGSISYTGTTTAAQNFYRIVVE